MLAALAAGGCKETVVKPDPNTEAALEVCRKTLEEKDKLVQAIQDENARMMREKTTGAEIQVAIEGNILTVKPAKPGTFRPIDDKLAAAASQEFIDVVTRSRGAIQKCYEQALKKDANLQARTITLTVSASFTDKGAYRDSSFAPSLGETFDTCMKTVASKWALKATSPSMTFKAPVSLTPS
jgi:hypothetical protein